MANESTVFPQIIRPTYDPSDAFPKMVNDAKNAARQIKGEFDSATGKIFKTDAQSGVFAGLSREAAQLRTAIDPLYAAQQRFNQAMDSADNLHRAGIISQREHTTATRLYREELQRANAAIHGVAEGARAGTTANHLMANSTRGLRQASVQAGQQLQDIAISIYSGQRASVVFAQQLPQLAFALTALEGSTNKAHAMIGRFATFLAGPWGLLVGGAVGILGTLAYELLNTEESSSKAEKGTKSLTERIKEQNTALRENLQLQGEKVRLELEQARRSSTDNTRQISIIQKGIDALRADLNAAPNDQIRNINGPAARGRVREVVEAQIKEFEAAKRKLADAQKLAEESIGFAQISAADRRIAGRVDPRVAETNRYEDALSSLRKEMMKPGGVFDDKVYERSALALKKDHLARMAVLDTQSKSVSSRSKQQVLSDFKSELESRGISVISTTRSASQQNSLFRQGLTPLDGYSKISRHQSSQAVDVDKRTHNDRLAMEAAQAAGLRGFKIVTESGGRKHYEWKGAGKSGEVDVAGAEASERKAAQAAEAAQRLAEFGRDARVQIEQMKAALAETPPALQAAARETERLDDLAASIKDKLPAGATEMLAEIEKLKVSAQELADGPFRDMLKSAAERAEIEKVLIEGGEFEAEVKRRVVDLERQQGALDEKRVNTIRAIVSEERARARLIEKQEVARRRELDYLQQTQDNIRQTTYELLKGDGFKAIGNLFKRQFDLVVQQMADAITESLFGDAFRDAKDKAMGFDKVKEASLRVAASSNIAADALNALASAANHASDSMDPANDNGHDVADQAQKALGEIVVTARSMRETLKDALNRIGKSLLGEKLFAKLQTAFKSVMESVAYGQFGSGILRSVGVKQSKTGASVGGAIGGAVSGPLGAFVGGMIGGTIGGLFKKTPKGNVVISNSGTTVSGSSKLSSGLQSLGSGVSDTLSSIAEQLGGTVGGYSVSVRQKGKKYYVNGQKFKDPEEAARAALLSAIQNGAVQGITQGAQSLLRAGQDVEKQLSKAVKFQNVFKELRSLKDPVGAAITELNNEFTSLISIFNEAGASAQEFADLEELYGLKRAEAIKSATEQMTGALKSLIDEMTIGDNGLSLRDRLANARAAFNPLASDVQSGKKVDYDAFAEAARALLDVQRQLSGSGGDYFKTFNEILSLSQTALAGQQNVVSIASAAGSPFAGVSTAEAVYSPIVGALNDQSQMMLVQLLSLNTTSQKLVDAMNAANANGTGFYANYATGTTYF